MNTMKIPGFTAERSLLSAGRRYRSGRPTASLSGAVVPAIPACRNCDYILDQCEKHGWRPRAVCNACAVGDCYEDPPNPDPFPDPFGRLPRF
jgi:hypothetical protein